MQMVYLEDGPFVSLHHSSQHDPVRMSRSPLIRVICFSNIFQEKEIINRKKFN